MVALGRSLGIVVAVTVVGALLALTLTSASGVGAASPMAPQVKTPYTVTFTETGLPSGTYWSVHVAYVGCGCSGVYKTVKSNTSSVVIPVTNGTYKYTVQKVPGYYVVGSAKGMFNVNGSNVTGISFVFGPVIAYVVEFIETGLPSGTLWTVRVHGNGTGQLGSLENQELTSYTTSMNFTLPNGTYHYWVAPVPGSFFTNGSSKGMFVVSGGPPSPLHVTFTSPPLYTVTFTETGLPVGTNWSVRVGGWGGVPIYETLSSTTSNILFQLPNGTYHFSIGLVLGFNTPTPASGSLVVTTSALTISVTFTPVVPGAFYPAAFQENGLATGTHWWVGIIATHTFGHSRTATQSSNGTTLFFLLQNGTYKFQVHGPWTYTITSGGAGSFTVAGSSPSVFLVSFAAIPTYGVTFSESGLATGTNWSVRVWTEFSGSTPWPIHTVQTANTTSMTFYLPNGTYCFKFYAVPGYTITSGVATGPFTVSGGSPPPIMIGFSPKA
jgi:hypothetical protein